VVSRCQVHSLKGDDESVSLATAKETECLDHIRQHVEGQTEINKEHMSSTRVKPAGNGKAASWSAYHGKREKHVKTRRQSSLLPLLPECAYSLAMIKHAITVVMKAVQHLNPGQAAVIAFDQPLYALWRDLSQSATAF